MPIDLARRTFLANTLSVGMLARGHIGHAKSSAAAIGTMPGAYRTDAELLERAYTALHPGLYRYNSPDEMAQRFAGLRRYLSAPRSRREAYLALARITAAVRCGHSYPNFYNQSKSLRAALFEERDRVPFHFRWIGQRMVLTRDLSAGAELPRGTEIHRIEDVEVGAILRALMPLARADGHNDAKRRRILEVAGIDQWEAFDIYLPMAFPHLVERGRIRILARDPAGRDRAVELDLLTAAQRRAAVPSLADQPKDAVLWSVDRAHRRMAILSMPTWAVYDRTWDWQAWLEGQLDRIATDGTTTLVVDLRGNEGGSDCGNAILARLIDRDLVAISNARRVRYRTLPPDLTSHVDTWDDSFRDWGKQAIGPRPDGFYDFKRWSDDAVGRILIKPAGKRFTGRLVVLIDASNSSATFQFAQIVKDNRLGTLIGEPTGGNRRGINGGAFLFLRLPASGIEVDIPLIGFFPPTVQPDAGILPDIAVQETAQDIAAVRDAILRRVAD